MLRQALSNDRLSASTGGLSLPRIDPAPPNTPHPIRKRRHLTPRSPTQQILSSQDLGGATAAATINWTAINQTKSSSKRDFPKRLSPKRRSPPQRRASPNAIKIYTPQTHARRSSPLHLQQRGSPKALTVIKPDYATYNSSWRLYVDSPEVAHRTSLAEQVARWSPRRTTRLSVDDVKCAADDSGTGARSVSSRNTARIKRPGTLETLYAAERAVSFIQVRK